MIVTGISQIHANPHTETAKPRLNVTNAALARFGLRELFVGLVLLCVVVPVSAQDTGKLEITGIDGELLANVLAYIALEEQPCDVPEWQLRRRARDMDERIIEATSAFGFYQPTIEKTLEVGEECWSATLQITAGPRVSYQAFDVRVEGEANNDPVVSSVVASAPQAGDFLHHGRYEAFKQRLTNVLGSRGYAESRFDTARLNVNPPDRSATATLLISSGPRYRLGAITIEQDEFDPDLVDRFVTLEPGGYFSREQLTRLQKDLSGSALFDRVLVSADYEQLADQQIPVTVRLTGAERLGYFVGAGVSTDRGPRLRGGYSNRRVNTRGHQLNADLLLSPALSQFNAVYRQPLARPLIEWQSYLLRLEDENTDTFDSESIQLGVERSRTLGNGWLLTYGVQLGRTDYRVGQTSDVSVLLMPVIGYDQRVADSDTNPRRGSSTEVRLRTAADAFWSTTSFFQAYARHRRLFAIGQAGRLSLGAEGGMTWTSDIDKLPPSVRFFTGGDASVRGYSYQSLGPRDESGEVVGGSRLVTASIEYEHTLRGNWGAAVFVDTGDAFDGNNISLNTGVGFGVVWRSPVGPLRAYLAHPLDDDDTDVRLHISFGADL